MKEELMNDDYFKAVNRMLLKRKNIANIKSLNFLLDEIEKDNPKLMKDDQWLKWTYEYHMWAVMAIYGKVDPEFEDLK